MRRNQINFNEASHKNPMIGFTIFSVVSGKIQNRNVERQFKKSNTCKERPICWFRAVHSNALFVKSCRSTRKMHTFKVRRLRHCKKVQNFTWHNCSKMHQCWLPIASETRFKSRIWQWLNLFVKNINFTLPNIPRSENWVATHKPRSSFKNESFHSFMK